jgi:hypothetical protein
MPESCGRVRGSGSVKSLWTTCEWRSSATGWRAAVAIVSSVEDLWAQADRHDLVVVAAHNRAHVPLGLAAIEAGDAPTCNHDSQRRLGHVPSWQGSAGASQIMAG